MRHNNEFQIFLVICVFTGLTLFGIYQWSKMGRPPHVLEGTVTIEVSPLPVPVNE